LVVALSSGFGSDLPKSQLYRIWAGRVELLRRSWLSSRAPFFYWLLVSAMSRR
jgi:hypothetical protein